MSAARSVLVDTTRLFTRLKHTSPTGIDRVDLAYARHYLGRGHHGRAVVVTPFGTRILPEVRMRELLRVIDKRWNEHLPAERDPVLADIHRRLGDGVEPKPARRRRTLPRIGGFDTVGRALQVRALRWSEVSDAPPSSVYLHTSHLRLDRPYLFDWLDRRRDIRAVFFVHDLIPIEFPEYGVPGESERHRVRMANISARAAAVAVNSQDVADRLDAYLASEGLRRPPITVASLGVEPVFPATSRRVEAGARPYFVVCSTIEARKNHLLLLQVWRELAASLGDATPKLVIVGRRGWESESAVDLLDRAPAMREHVVEATSLSTAGLAHLVAGARALVMPSFAEGYGIPVVEALSVGTPVIAADIPVFREVTQGLATLLHPLDGLGWRDTVLRLAAEPPRTVPGFVPPTWAEHFRLLDEVVAGL